MISRDVIPCAEQNRFGSGIVVIPGNGNCSGEQSCELDCKPLGPIKQCTNACGGSLLGATIAILGAAFKPESDDVRDSPALTVAGMLQLNGASVNVYDPEAIENSQRIFPTLK